MANYSVRCPKASAAASAPNTIGDLSMGATPQRCRIYDVIVGSTTTPADITITWDFQRRTGDGVAGTAITPQPLDPADAAALAVGNAAPTTDPTYTANAIVLAMTQNQRATVRWFAAPGSELVIPATADNGIGARSTAINGGTPDLLVTMQYSE